MYWNAIYICSAGKYFSLLKIANSTLLKFCDPNLRVELMRALKTGANSLYTCTRAPPVCSFRENDGWKPYQTLETIICSNDGVYCTHLNIQYHTQNLMFRSFHPLFNQNLSLVLDNSDIWAASNGISTMLTRIKRVCAPFKIKNFNIICQKFEWHTFDVL